MLLQHIEEAFFFYLMANKLASSFYTRTDVVEVARELIGCKLCTSIGGVNTSGIIVETEAYNGRTDRACHAYPNKKTKRTAIMYQNGGIAYVYFVYGMHFLFNVVTHKKHFADAVLVRAIEPIDGIEAMWKRRGNIRAAKGLTSGPARLTQALGITKNCNGVSLQGNTVWIEPRSVNFTDAVQASCRIGIEYAGKDALLPWRFYMENNPYVSK